LNEIDWTGREFDSTGRILGWLLAQDGWFYNRHQAESDVDAVIQLMTHVHEGRPALRELLLKAARTTWHVKAVGAHFSVKDRLKTRRYHWDPDELVWSREVADENLIEEKIWLEENIYAPECKARTSAPSIRPITWNERYAG
jgi:DNA polymerase-3 subunit epsilon